jgi:hypothetical protein
MDFIHRAVTKTGHEQPSVVGEFGLVECGFQLPYFSKGYANIDDNENWSFRTVRSQKFTEVFQKQVIFAILHSLTIQFVDHGPRSITAVNTAGLDSSFCETMIRSGEKEISKNNS